ncbi:MAG TPA: hypothetical protein VKQ70_03900 [Caulobacteraceae bacterium]|jgi:hypothetical protein|nr:hypothetical protein [Caulobacteraceae bacterium]
MIPIRTRVSHLRRTALAGVAMALGAALTSAAGAADVHAAPAPYPNMAPMAQYRIASQADEIALARSAAPPSISNDADVMTLGDHGYETAAKGKNGFVCIVERSWSNDFGDAEFWNPKVRAPICFNPVSARSVLPTYLHQTEWLLAGASQAQLEARTKADIAAGRIAPPEVGAMCYMMSKDGYLGDGAGGHWHPHLMFFLPHDGKSLAAWGANLPGVPVQGGATSLDPAAVYYVIVAHWSDGTPAAMGM